jgi:hypothetical protein
MQLRQSRLFDEPEVDRDARLSCRSRTRPGGRTGHPLGTPPGEPVYIESPGLEVPILSFPRDVMFRRIVIAFFSLTACLLVVCQVNPEQTPSAGS